MPRERFWIVQQIITACGTFDNLSVRSWRIWQFYIRVVTVINIRRTVINSSANYLDLMERFTMCLNVLRSFWTFLRDLIVCNTFCNFYRSLTKVFTFINVCGTSKPSLGIFSKPLEVLWTFFLFFLRNLHFF